MFEWKRKQLENEQVKFFGGTQKGFISCYAKQVKPRIKIKLKPIKNNSVFTEAYQFDLMVRASLGQAQQLSNLQHQCGSQFLSGNLAAQQQFIGMQNAGTGSLAAGMGLAHNALYGGLGAAAGYRGY